MMQERNSLEGLAAKGDALYSVIPIIVTSLWSLAFILVAIWRFRREEF
jgi:lipopolysaccharide export LptBFGC system permease protein LptF